MDSFEKIKELICETEEENELLSHITNNILPEIETINLDKVSIVFVSISKLLPTSLITCLLPKVPNVIIGATFLSPYLFIQ